MRCALATVLVAILACLAGAPPAGAQTAAAPGNAAVEQYLEAVPSADGTSAPARGDGGGGADRGGTSAAAAATLPAATRRALAAAGPDGAAVAALAAASPAPATARPGATGGARSSRASRSSSPRARVEGSRETLAAAPVGSGSAAGALTTGVTTGGMGPVLPVLLGLSLLVGGGLAVRRLRAR